MPTPEECNIIVQEFTALETLKTEFDSAYGAATTGQLSRAKELKATLEQKLEALREKLNPLEGLVKLKEQYQAQRDILKKVGILERLPSGNLGIKGIDNEEYPLPTYQEISQMIREGKEIYKTKAEQGFIKLVLVPFGMKLDDLIDKYKAALLKHYTEGKLYFTKKDPNDPKEKPVPITENEFNKTEPVWVWEEYRGGADVNNKLVYFPKDLDKDPLKHQGQTKQNLLKQNQAWQIILLEDMPNIPKQGETQERGGRKQIDNQGTSIRQYMDSGQTTPSPREYLKALQSHPQYVHEQGTTPEDWLAYALTYLEETDQVIDDYQGSGKVSYNLGGYFPASDRVPRAYWSRGFRRTGLGWNVPGDRNGGFGVRPSVRVKRLKV